MQDVLQAAKNLGCVYNVTARVYDRGTGRLVSEHIGHNQATCSMMLGIAHYLQGDGILNQAPGMLSKSIPMYMSLGTMGLISQDADDEGLPTGIGVYDDVEKTEEEQFVGYMQQLPGFGADGYDENENNERPYFGLGPMYESGDAINCELISGKFVRTPITYRAILPEAQAELPETIDIVFSAMISTGALAQFRNGSDHVFITELGLWSNKEWSDSVENGLLAGYRIIPSSSENWDMTVQKNRDVLKRSILRVGKNQVVQIIWKIQLGSIEQFGGYVEAYRDLAERFKRLQGEGSAVGVPTLMLQGSVVSASGIPSVVLTPTVDGVQVAQPYAVSKFLYSTSLPYGNYGTSVITRLEISEESSHTTLQSGGWSASGMCYYSAENQIGAYAGYEFDETYRIDSVKLWIGIYSEQNITLYVTVQYLGTDDTWNDVETVSVGPTTSYPSNVVTVQFNSSIPVKGVRWIHKDQPAKSGGNNITFAGMTIYRAT